MESGTALWERCVRRLRAEIPEQDFNTWIRPLQADDNGAGLRLYAPNRFVLDWLNSQFMPRIREIAKSIHGEEVQIELSVGSANDNQDRKSDV